ncbi:MAG: alkaline phosphatase family protein [Acidobacteria bacterium]|nr:alkaline phosphatase family protein [Acidobacteriota bacterium]
MRPGTAGRIWIFLIAFAALIIAGLAVGVTRVPPGNIGVLPDGKVLPPGWHLRLFASRPELEGPGALSLEGEARLDTPEGSRLAISYRLEVLVDPETLQHVSENLGLGAPGKRWKDALTAVLKETIAADGGSLLYTGVVRRTVLERLRSSAAPLPGSRVVDLKLGVAAAGGQSSRLVDTPIIFIGLDGADWLFMKPLLAAGKLPALADLISRGARAQLRSARPLLSPLLWTSMVTGVSPDRHGIVDFTVYDPAIQDRTPISSGARRRPALWNVLTGYGLHGAWIGWWATWPAEPVAGLMVSDQVSYSLFALDDAGSSSHKVFPAPAWREVRKRIISGGDVPWNDLRRFARLTDADVTDLEARPALKPGQEFEDRLEHLRQILASTRTYHALALWAREVLQPDLLAVYYQGIDEVSHRFMHYASPVRMEVPPDEVARFGKTVEEFYRYQDKLLGELIAGRNPGSPGREPVVLVVSDHGFLSGEARPLRPADEFEGGAADWHRLHGIFILAGPGVRKADLGSVSIYDLFPTLLYLCGIPVPEGLPGRALLEALEPSLVRQNPLRSVADLEVPFGSETPATTTLPQGERTEALARLRALGYVGGFSGPIEAAGALGKNPPSTAQGDLRNEFLTAHMNLGTVYAEREEWEQAAREYRSVAERFPRHAPGLYKWMESEFQGGNSAAAWEAAERLLALPSLPPEWVPGIAEVAAAAGHEATLENFLGGFSDASSAHAARGVLAAQAGRPQEAAAYFRRALDAQPLRTEAIDALFTLESSPDGREDLTRRLYKALEIAPRSVFHLNYLAGLLVSAGRCEEARPHILAALEESPDSAPALANLAKCLVAQGQLEQAVAALERGLRVTPDDHGLLTTLGALEASRGRLPRAIELLERARERFPRDSSILNALGLAQLQSGRPEEARQLLEQSLEADPDQPDVRSLLSQAGG